MVQVSGVRPGISAGYWHSVFASSWGFVQEVQVPERDAGQTEGPWQNLRDVGSDAFEGSMNTCVFSRVLCCLPSAVNLYLYQQKSKGSHLSVSLFRISPLAVCVTGCVSFLSLCEPVCLWDTCSVLLLIEPVEGKVAAMHFSLDRDRWSLGPGLRMISQAGVVLGWIRILAVSCSSLYLTMWSQVSFL